MLDRLAPELQPEGDRVQAKPFDGSTSEEGEAIGSRVRGDRALEQAVNEDHVGSGELVATGDEAPDVRAVVHEQLQIEPGSKPARVAVAACRLFDAAQPAPEGEVGGLEGVDEQKAVRPLILDVQEGCIALELRQAERRLEPADDGLEQVAGDRRRVLELAARKVGRVAGQIGDHEIAGLGEAHVATLRLGAAPRSTPKIGASWSQ